MRDSFIFILKMQKKWINNKFLSYLQFFFLNRKLLILLKVLINYLFLFLFRYEIE
jgi:hypothetical protein